MDTVLDKSLFGAALDSLAADNIKTIQNGTTPEDLVKCGAPNNEQILQAVKESYREHQVGIDKRAYFTNNFGHASQNRGLIQRLNGCTWNNSVDSDAIQQVANDPLFPVDDVSTDEMFTTMYVGVNVDAQFFIGGSGGVGGAWDRLKRENTSFLGFYLGKIGVQIDSEINFMVGAFNRLPSELKNSTFFGLQITTAAGIGATLNLFVDTSLKMLGFTTSIGLGIGSGASIFAGQFRG